MKVKMKRCPPSDSAFSRFVVYSQDDLYQSAVELGRNFISMNPRRPSSFRVPWRMFTALFLAGVFLVVLYRAFPPGLEHSRPVVTVRDQTATVEFEVTNHKDNSVNATLLVKIGRFTPGGEFHPPRFDTYDQQKVAVALGRNEMKPIRCAFPRKHHVPAHAEVSILP